jgi:hypothetical protein
MYIEKNIKSKTQYSNKKQKISIKKPSSLNKLFSKKQTTKKQTTKKQTTKKQPTKKQPTKKQTTKKQTTNKQSTKKQSTNKQFLSIKKSLTNKIKNVEKQKIQKGGNIVRAIDGVISSMYSLSRSINNEISAVMNIGNDINRASAPRAGQPGFSA